MPSGRGSGAKCAASVTSTDTARKTQPVPQKENSPSFKSKPVAAQKKTSSPGVLAISTCPTKPRRSSSSSNESSTYQSSTPSCGSSSPSESYFSCYSSPPASNFKSAICHFWQQTGKCANGDSCHFAHGAEEKRYWDRKLRQGASQARFGDDGDDDDDEDNARLRRVQRTFRNDGQFSSQAFAKDKRDVRQGGRKLSTLASSKRLN